MYGYRGASNQTVALDKKYLEFNFSVGEFYAKMLISRIFWAPFIYHNLGPLLFQVVTQNSKLALDWCCACHEVSKMLCHNPMAQTLTKKIGSLEMGFCQPCALVVCPMGLVTKPNATTSVLYWLWKFIQDSNIQSKVIQFLPRDKQTDTHTFCIPICKDKIFSALKCFSFHFTLFITSLTHSLCLWRITGVLWTIPITQVNNSWFFKIILFSIFVIFSTLS